MSHPFRKSAAIALTAAIGLAWIGTARAQADMGALPPVQQNGSVDYLTGGIGQDESTTIDMESKRWPLTLVFGTTGGRAKADYLADVQVSVRDQRGNTALDVKSDGPYLLARLSPGTYDVQAEFAGKTLHRKVVVRAGHPVRTVMLWPASAEYAAS
jgi:hypothetical protein